ncbi:urea ABC transporter permease subunit UrtB [Thermophilibacter sp.]
MELFLSQLVNGISNSAILFLAAAGMVIIFGMLGVVNMAHGEFIMVGAYVGCTVVGSLGLPFPVACVLAFVFTALLGVVIERLIIRRLYGKVAETMLATFGLTYILQQIVRMIFGPEDQHLAMPIDGSVQIGPVMMPAYNLFLVAAALVALGVTMLLFFKTSFGMQLRAVTQNSDMCRCLGINVERVNCLTFAYSCGLAGLAGVLIGVVKSITPSMGTTYLVDSFLVVVLGGLNSLVGTLAGSTVMGELQTLMAGYMSDTTARLIIFAVIIVIIRFRPQGLFASRERR